MADWLRQFLMPATVLAIVATVWSLAWSNEIQWKAVRAARAAGCRVVIHEDGDDSSSVQLLNIPKPTDTTVAVLRDDGDR